MDATLRPVGVGENRFAWQLGPHWCSQRGLFGGALFGALLEAMESASGLPAITGTCQYIRPVPQAAQVAIEVTALTRGRSLATLSAVASVNGDACAMATATLASLPSRPDAVRAAPPVPPPAACPPRSYRMAIPDGLQDWLDVHVADVTGRRVCLWVRSRLPVVGRADTLLLAAITDHPPFAFGLVMGASHFGASLAHHINLHRPLPDAAALEWVLVEISLETISADFAFAATALWSQAGDLIATGGQSMRVRPLTALAGGG
jgi:acyl-CoA thioesterase